MKKIISLSFALMLASAMTLSAQTAYKVDEVGLGKQIDKSNATIADVKKNTKAATWVSRGDLFLKIADAPVAGIYPSLPLATSDLLFGKSKKQNKKVGDIEFETRVYPYFTTYTTKGGDMVEFWDQTKFVDPDALAKAEEAYYKAYELDPKAKIKDNRLELLAQYYKKDADNYFKLRDYAKASDAFAKAYAVQKHPAVGIIDTSSIYNAGLLAVFAENYDKGIEYLTESYNLEDYNDGNLFYYLQHSYFKKGDIASAKKVLFDGLKKFPDSSEIVEGLLFVYTAPGEDPKEIIAIVQEAVQNDPKNPVLWSGLGRVYDALGNFDESINAFREVDRLVPNDFDTNYNIGLLHTKKADELNRELNSKNFTSQREYDVALNDVRDAYQEAIPAFENALALKQNDKRTVDMLRGICQRVQTRPGMKEKYEKYKALSDELEESAQ